MTRGQEFGDLRLGEALGSGAVATVVRVHAADGRTFAGKILHGSHQQDEAAALRFAQEAALLHALRDEHVVAVHGVAEVDGGQVLLLELVEGPTLATLIALEAPMPETRLLTLARGIARGLAVAHAAGIVHRDLKPANVLVQGGHTPKIADFGMARASSFAGVDPRALAVLGTPDYMAPESTDPLAVDVRSDLYALGCILHEMATGRPPYAGATAFAVIEAHRRAEVPVLPDSYSLGLRALAQALLAKSPGDRPQSAAAVAAAIDALLAGEPLALAVVPAAGAGPACSACGQPLVVEVGACMNCGLVTARAEPGDVRVLVAGPGETSDKLDVELRDRLVRWISGNPGLGVAPGLLAEKIPRLPFTLLGGLSRASAEAAAAALRGLGFEVELVQGGALRSPGMRKKSRTLMGRALGVALGSYVFLYNSKLVFFALPMMIVGVLTGSLYSSTRQVTARGEQRPALPPALQRPLAAVSEALPAIAATRHRHSLRAVVRRVLALSQRLGPAAAEELGRALHAATAAAGRLDALDRALSGRDLRAGEAEVRALLHERDTWSARLLELSAALDAHHARLARAGALQGGGEAAERLGELRARVEALEEVQRG